MMFLSKTFASISPKGQYLVKVILDCEDLELGFVWNRTYESLSGHVDDNLILQDLNKFSER